MHSSNQVMDRRNNFGNFGGYGMRSSRGSSGGGGRYGGGHHFARSNIYQQQNYGGYSGPQHYYQQAPPAHSAFAFPTTPVQHHQQPPLTPQYHPGYQQHHHQQPPPYFQPQPQPHQQPYPPVVTPRRDTSNDCFHQHQQFEAIFKANIANDIRGYHDMRAYYEERCSDDELFPEIELPKESIFTMNIHGNEFRHLIVQLPHFGNEISERMPLIHQKTLCRISLADRHVGRDLDFNKITFTGPTENIEEASVEFLDMLPLHIGMHLHDMKDEFKKEDSDLRKNLIEWIEEKTYDYPTISFHFVKDAKEPGSYKYVVMREARERAETFIKAVYEFSKLALNKPLTTEFSAGYRLPHSDRAWFLGIPEGTLVKALCDQSGTTIKYSNINSSANALDYSIFGSPQSLIVADGLLRKISQVTLQFDVDDDDLQEPLNDHPPNGKTQFIENTLVLVSYAPSQYEMPGAADAGYSIRHTITIRTSYENRHMLYKTRRMLLKPELTNDEPLSMVEKSHETPLFTEYLRKILMHLEKN